MTIFKPLAADDRVSTKTLLHEAIPITGTIVSGTYLAAGVETNIQDFTHGMFQSVYDYPYLSSSANHIFDISIGTSKTGLATTVQTAKKDNIYNQMAQVLMGYDSEGKIQKFDSDGNLVAGGDTIDDAIFLSFSRLLVKDEIKKGSFEFELGVNHDFNDPMRKRIKILDKGAATSYRVNSPAGEFGILYATKSVDTVLDMANLNTASIDNDKYWRAGLIYYQAGVVVLSNKIFQTNHASVTIKATGAAGVGQEITIKTIDGSSVTITGHGSTTSGTQFDVTSVNNGLTALKTALETSTIAAKITVSDVQTVVGGFLITVTQNTAGQFLSAADKNITSNLVNMSVGGAALASSGEFSLAIEGGLLNQGTGVSQMHNTSFQDLRTMIESSQISSSANGLRKRIYNLQFNNTIELNSTVYFCRAKHNEFNYSSNPTYLSGSQIRVKNQTTDIPISYITSIGLYSSDNQLLAVGKFSEPIRKDSNIELTFRARLDY